ncbi:uncharacterized protein [Primulina eburnea]|uniref:uncharacterized protein n=1 Tax=Primulina eburnea TaxID=1245227 RepID=UPI003C6C1566
MMGSKKAELYQISVGQKRKKLDARAFKALFKRQRINGDLPDIHGKLEGPDNMSHICNGNDRVISSKPIGEGEDVSDECSKRLKENSRQLSIDKESGGNLQKSIGNSRRNDSEILGNNVTVNSDYIDDVVAESLKPLGADSLIDAKTDSSTRKSFDDSERLPTGCSITENTSTSGSADCMVGPQHVDPAIGADCLIDNKTDSSTRKCFDDSERLPTGCSITENPSTSGSADCMVGPQRVDPAIGELTELQGTQGTASKEGHSTITATNLAESLQMDGVSTDNDPNSMSGRKSFGAEVGTGGLEERFSLLSEQNSKHNFLQVELGRLCQILKLSEDVTHRVGEFLEYVIQNHDLSSDAPAIMHAFQLSVCWIATRIAKKKFDKKEYFNLAKKHLNYQCTEEQVYSVYSKMLPLKLMFLKSSENASDSGKDCMLTDEDSSKEPSHMINSTPLFSLSNGKKAKVEIEENFKIILKQKSGMNVKASESEIRDKIQKKCEKRMKKLVRKQEEELQGLLRTWEEEKVKLEKDHELESAVTCFIYGQGFVQTSKLKILDDKFAKKMEEHNLLKDMQLNSLKEKQLAARSEACEKASDWLAEAVACASMLGTVNGPQPFGFQSENGPECTGSGTHIGLENVVTENVVTMFQEHAEDPNPNINLCPQGNDVAPSDAAISVLAETTDSGLAETMSYMETFSSPNEVVLMSLERPSETLVGQLNQLFQSCNTTEDIGAANLPACGEQITDEIRPVEMYQEGPTELTRPVSNDIVLHGDPVESNKTSNIGDSIGLPNTEVNHRSEPCQSSNGSLPLPGQPLVHPEEMLAFPDRCGLLKQHVSHNEIHQVASAELEDRDTPAAEIQNTSQLEVATTELSDAVTLVQLNHAVPVTGNGEQLNHLSADAPLVCIQYQPHEMEHQNRDQGTNLSPTVLAGEREDFLMHLFPITITWI